MNGLVSAASRRVPEALVGWARIDTAAIAPRIAEAYGESNARPSVLIDRDLGALGYPVADTAQRVMNEDRRALASNG